MTSILLHPESTGVDGVSLSTLRNFSKVKAAGFEWVSLYLGGNYGVHDYAIEAAWDAGLKVMLNYERSPSDAKNGYPAGKKAAETALRQARELGFRGEAPLPFSAADEHFADLSGAGLDYHRALVDVLAPEGWVGGAYGFREMLALIAQQSWWPDDWPLWHWGGDGKTIYPWTWVKQGPGGSYFDTTIGLQVDRNTLYKPMRFWSGYGADHVDPQEDDMQPDERQWLKDLHAAIVEASSPVVDHQGNKLSGEWITYYLGDALFKGQLAAPSVDAIAAAVVAALPPASGGGLTEAQVTAAVKVALRQGTG